MLDYIIDRISPQVGEILINSNTPLQDVSFPVVEDYVSGNQGPLAGILTGLRYFDAQGTTASHMLCIPSDAPFVPLDLVEKLQAGLTGNIDSICMAYSGERIHPVVSLWPFSLMKKLEDALVKEELRKILVFAERYSLTSVKWSNENGDPFFNVNRPEDLEVAIERVKTLD